jgi:hypothetical protein
MADVQELKCVACGKTAKGSVEKPPVSSETGKPWKARYPRSDKSAGAAKWGCSDECLGRIDHAAAQENQKKGTGNPQKPTPTAAAKAVADADKATGAALTKAKADKAAAAKDSSAARKGAPTGPDADKAEEGKSTK